jgi:hypothetical protein
MDQSIVEDLVTPSHILANEGVLDGLGHISVRHPDNPQHYLMCPPSHRLWCSLRTSWNMISIPTPSTDRAERCFSNVLSTAKPTKHAATR